MTNGRLVAMAAARASEAFAVKNTFLHFADEEADASLSPGIRRRGTRAMTEPASKFLLEEMDTEDEGEEELEENEANQSYECPVDTGKVERGPASPTPPEGHAPPASGLPLVTPPHRAAEEATHSAPCCPRRPAQPLVTPPHAAAAKGPAEPPRRLMREEQWRSGEVPLPTLLAIPCWARPQEAVQGLVQGRGGAHLPAGASATRSSHLSKAETSSQASPAPAHPQALELIVNSSGMVVRWTVDAKKLRGSDKGLVSPPFELPFSSPTPFKIMLSPKGSMSFGKAGGKASILLKCGMAMEDDLDSTRIVHFSLGSGSANMPRHSSRGPIRHNFAQNGVCGLPKDQQEWDFSKAVDNVTHTVTVCIEILPGDA